MSLPRSGSTLLQRMLAAHDAIASTSEPWILLPFIYCYKPTGVVSEYSHINSSKGISEFMDSLPGGQAEFEAALKEFAERLYTGYARNNERYFLDKTPRYHLIIDELFRIFPEAKFIFLFRSPVQILSSIISTYGQSLKKLYTHSVDFRKGITNLSQGYEKYRSRSIAVDYDRLTKSPEQTLKKIMDYLELDYSPELLDSFGKVTFQGTMGDPNYEQKKSVSKDGTDKWKKQVINPVRKKLYERVILSVDEHSPFFYQKSKSAHLEELANINARSYRNVIDDIGALCYGYMYLTYKPHLAFGSFMKQWTRAINLN